MTIDDAISCLKKEQALPSRFHCRAILVDTIAQYRLLLEKLKQLDDMHVVPVEALFSGADIMPQYEKLTGAEYQDHWFILPGVSEYLRLFHDNEAAAQRFGTLWHFKSDAASKGRVIIPLWGCQSLWYDQSLGFDNDTRQKDFVFDCTDDTADETQKYRLQVLSGDFEQYISQLSSKHSRIFIGLREWYQFWYEPSEDDSEQILLTKRYKSIRNMDGDARIHVIQNTLGFIRENLLDGAALNAEICPVEAQNCLVYSALAGKSIREGILSSLNLLEWESLDVMKKWKSLPDGKKQLVMLWYRLYADDSYLCYCVHQTPQIEELERHILMDIFSVRSSHPVWVGEAQELMAVMAATRDDAYFEALQDMPSFEERLDFLSADSPRERRYILHMVGQWLRANPEEVLQCGKLKERYPRLAVYLDDQYPDPMLNAYFKKYKMYKLSNTLPQDEEVYFSGVAIDNYPYRYPVLAEEIIPDQTFILWIDALGIEWLPLLKWVLQKDCEGTLVSVQIAQAQLPTETKYNEQWTQMDVPHEKYNGLDKLAHQGAVDDRDYYRCIEEQFSFIAGLAKKVNELLKQYRCVLITGDHGTSRLAARFFHKRQGLPLPKQAINGSHGRFCMTSSGQAVQSQNQVVKSESDGTKYLVFCNYDHYSQSGFAAGSEDDAPTYGEIHGGATPEEALVPVIAIHNPNVIPLTATWGMQNKSVKIAMKKATCTVIFSRPVSSVQAQLDDLAGDCSAETVPGRQWTIVFRNIKRAAPQICSVSIQADGSLVNIEPIEIIPALGGNDPF